MNKFIKKFSDISINDIESVGGKNASLGEMINNLSSLGVNVPDGFATTSYAFQAVSYTHLTLPTKRSV